MCLHIKLHKSHLQLSLTVKPLVSRLGLGSGDKVSEDPDVAGSRTPPCDRIETSMCLRE